MAVSVLTKFSQVSAPWRSESTRRRIHGPSRMLMRRSPTDRDARRLLPTARLCAAHDIQEARQDLVQGLVVKGRVGRDSTLASGSRVSPGLPSSLITGWDSSMLRGEPFLPPHERGDPRSTRGRPVTGRVANAGESLETNALLEAPQSGSHSKTESAITKPLFPMQIPPQISPDILGISGDICEQGSNSREVGAILPTIEDTLLLEFGAFKTSRT